MFVHHLIMYILSQFCRQEAKKRIEGSFNIKSSSSPVKISPLTQTKRFRSTSPTTTANSNLDVELAGKHNKVSNASIDFKAHALHSTPSPAIVEIHQSSGTQSSASSSLLEVLGVYSEGMSEKEPTYLSSLREEVAKQYPTASVQRMLSSASQAAMLSMLATISRSERVLELGSFVGYSTIALAMDYNDFTQKPNQNDSQIVVDREVISCELDPKAYGIAQLFIERNPFNRNVSQSS